MSNTPLVNTRGRARAAARVRRSCGAQSFDSSEGGAVTPALCRSEPDFLAVAIEVLNVFQAAIEKNGQIAQDCAHNLVLPDPVELDLFVQPMLQPVRVGE